MLQENPGAADELSERPNQEDLTMRASRSKPRASMAFNEGTCDGEEENFISIDHTRFGENASIVQYLCHYLLSEPSKDLSKLFTHKLVKRICVSYRDVE